MEKEELKKIFSTHLHLRRQELDIKQETVQRETQISLSNYSKYENGKLLPQLDTAVKLAEYFGVSLDELCGRRHSISNYLQVIDILEDLAHVVNLQVQPIEMTERGHAEEVHIVIKDSALATYFFQEQKLRTSLAIGVLDREDYDIFIQDRKKAARAISTNFELSGQ